MAADMPTQGQGHGLPSRRPRDPFHSLREEMDRLFDAFVGGLPSLARRPSLAGGEGNGGVMMAPEIDVHENEKELIIEAELPGIDEKDISLTVQGNMLTLRGEKKAEMKEDKDNYHLMERHYGSFQRTLRLPETVDEDKAEAKFEKGVLKITLPKRPEMVKTQKKIEIGRTI